MCLATHSEGRLVMPLSVKAQPSLSSGPREPLNAAKIARYPLRGLEHRIAQIVQVADQPIHGVTDHRIALTHVPRQLLKLRRWISLPEALSTNRLSSLIPSSRRSSFDGES
jgi:hypothetical protein